jgi:hypothetical protein
VHGAFNTDIKKFSEVRGNRRAPIHRSRKTGIAVDMGLGTGLRAALDAHKRTHVTIINTERGGPFTVDGFSGFMQDAMRAAGLPLDCKPHGLRP